MSGNILIAYYTHSGNTKKIAELIRKETGGTLFELHPILPYPADYNAVVEQAKAEIQKGYRPPLKAESENIEGYDTIFIGSPNWWSTIAPPIATFLSGHDLSGKTILPFCTHGGGGGGRVEKDIAKLCPKSNIKSGLIIYDDGGPDASALVSSWLQKLEEISR